VRLNCQKSAEAIVPLIKWEGLNDRRSLILEDTKKYEESRQLQLQFEDYLYERRVEPGNNTGVQSISSMSEKGKDDIHMFVNSVEPPYAGRHVRWCERTAVQLMDSLLLDFF
jgi:hypothetical protein